MVWLVDAHHVFPAGKLSGSGTTSTGVVQLNVSAPRRTHAEEVFSAQNSHQEDKEDSQMMWLVLAFVVLMASVRWVSR